MFLNPKCIPGRGVNMYYYLIHASLTSLCEIKLGVVLASVIRNNCFVLALICFGYLPKTYVHTQYLFKNNTKPNTRTPRPTEISHIKGHYISLSGLLCRSSHKSSFSDFCYFCNGLSNNFFFFVTKVHVQNR